MKNASLFTRSASLFTGRAPAKINASRFGDPFLVSNAYRRKISVWPRILPKDGPGLRRF